MSSVAHRPLEPRSSWPRPATGRADPRGLARWLLVVAALVFLIVIVGGITRITESGLSITEWKPIRGIVPPLNDAQWQAEFANYRRIPQYAAFNRGMTLAGFQAIYFWEYLHRLLARAIGTVLGLVLLVYWWRRAIPAGYGRRIIGILLLGGLQGVIGWWMVASGLQDRVEVSHIRLAIHLLAALLIYTVLIWTALDLRRLDRNPAAPRARLTGLGAAAILVLAVQIMFGAFTAGLRAGYAFASWPLMGDSLFPSDGWQAGWTAIGNVVDNPVVVQFIHRWWAWVVVAMAAVLALRTARRGADGRAAIVGVIVAVQVLLGIATLLLGVPIPIAIAHQAGAALLLASFVAAAHALGTPVKKPTVP